MYNLRSLWLKHDSHSIVRCERFREKRTSNKGKSDVTPSQGLVEVFVEGGHKATTVREGNFHPILDADYSEESASL